MRGKEFRKEICTIKTLSKDVEDISLKIIKECQNENYKAVRELSKKLNQRSNMILISSKFIYNVIKNKLKRTVENG